MSYLVLNGNLGELARMTAGTTQFCRRHGLAEEVESDLHLVVNDRQQRYVKWRLANAILADDIPDTRDIMLVSIAEQCGLLSYVLSDTHLNSRTERIQTLCNLETISRKVGDAIAGLDASRQQSVGKIV